MITVLDNPIWHALSTVNNYLSVGNGDAKFYRPEVAPFAALQSPAEENLPLLCNILPEKCVKALAIAGAIDNFAPFTLLQHEIIWQMVCEDLQGESSITEEIISLADNNVPAMLELTKLTNPGPFFERTIEFGNYSGIFKDGRLAAMAGYRMQTDNYTEISAVCTHPDFAGKGYARALLLLKARQIIQSGKTPFLHVRQHNTRAIELYKACGFVIRKAINFYMIKKG